MTCADLRFDDIETGQKAELAWAPTMDDIDRFAALSGDYNPLHMDRAWAQANGFADRVVHGMMLAAKVSALVGMMLPGRRCLLLDYNLSHPNPVYAQDRVWLRGEVRDRWPDLSLIELAIRAVKDEDQSPKTVARGTVRCKILP